jgi:hypothetical protein
MIGRRRGEDACGLYRGPRVGIDRLSDPDGSPRLHNPYRKGSSPKPQPAQWPKDIRTDGPFSVVSARKTRKITPGKSTLRLPSIDARVHSRLILSGALYPPRRVGSGAPTGLKIEIPLSKTKNKPTHYNYQCPAFIFLSFNHSFSRPPPPECPLASTTAKPCLPLPV